MGILSMYPPGQDAAAGFATSLADALVALLPRMSADMVRLLSAQPSSPPGDDAHEMPDGVAAGSGQAARELNKFDVVVIQHEHGIQGEADAEQLLDLVDLLMVPVVLVVRTVLSEPTAHQRYVLEMLALSADAVVAMSRSGHRRLLDDYRVEPRRLMLIPHGNQGQETLASWPTVADKYRRVFDAVTRRPPAPSGSP